MKLIPQTPKKALKAFLKQKLLRSEIDVFKTNLIALLDKIAVIETQPTDESEEHLKNNLRDFLRDTYYRDTNAINTKDRKDLVIHLGKTTDSETAVIIEAKRPTNLNEMVSAENTNRKALHELILYYLDERNKAGNIHLKNLVITNVNEWYIIDANHFDKHIYRNTQIRKLYETKINDRKDNPFFYEEISKIIQKSDIEMPCVYFDIRDCNTILRNNIREDDKALSALFKILSPQHLLKIASPNDSNALNEKFYRELLHIIGLEEAREGTKNIIRRKIVNRNAASLIELVIDAINTEDTLHRLPDASIYGKTREERIFSVALELCITWINRILFLKLLESQLVSYHKSPASFGGGRKAEDDYLFLNTETIHDFDELFKLFHKVLAVNLNDRTDAIKSKYSRVPYLNSSLFEISELEDQIIKINSLDNDGQLELIGTTILKDVKKNTGKLPTLDYLFRFLDAYDFASEGTDEVQEDNKNIINASVLGKVFEKINGYKDGSIFTPGFITMYMCRKSIRLAVIQKFRERYGWTIETFDDIKNYLANRRSTKDILEFNAVINSLRICDPAVGSGHFLVSSLNELILIKYELGLLADENGLCISDYKVEIINDELRVFDANTDDEFSYLVPKVVNRIVKYRFGGDKYQTKIITNQKHQRIQKTLFHEKQTIIENSLFGVDINPNSVKICRLRLWIELLKNAYYPTHQPPLQIGEGVEEGRLETLPNIDINIKCGNSLLSRFALDADLSKALKSIKYDIKAYRGFVNDYKNEKNRDVKRGLQKIIDSIKGDFRTEILSNDPKLIRLNKLGGELYTLLNQTMLFGEDEKQKKARKEKQQKIEAEINKLSTEIEDIKSNAIYKNAFEWRFEFPEVLNNDGEFEGFDLVIGNPPYFSISTDEKLKILADKYETYSQTGDIYALFYELANKIQKANGLQALIISNKWMRANYGSNLRHYILEKSNPLFLIDFGQNLIFDTAIVHTSIIVSKRSENKNELSGVRFDDNKFFEFVHTFSEFIEKNKIESLGFSAGPWNIIDGGLNRLKQKIENNAKPIKNWEVKINFGIKTGLNEAFIIDKAKRDMLIDGDKSCAKFMKPILRGRDTRKYYAEYKDFYLINIPKGYTIKSMSGFTNIVMEPMTRYGSMEHDEAWDWFKRNHHSLANYLLTFKTRAQNRDDKGDFWWELRACSYIEAFEKPKIIFSEIVSHPQFYYDEKGFYPEATVFFISGDHLKYLTALLNSKAVTFFFKSFYMGGELVGKIRYKKAFLEQTPIPVPTEKQEIQIVALVNKILEAKQQGYDTTGYEQEIDEMVYKLYELTEEEIKIVEGK